MTDQQRISIVLADDHHVVREGLRSLLEREGFIVVGEGADGAEAVALAKAHAPDIAILDFGMPRLNGLDAARVIAAEAPRTRTILLTVHTEDQYVFGALEAGIKGYVVKTQAAVDLVTAIREVHRGSTYLSPSVSQTVMEARCGKKTRAGHLTPRERQVLQLVSEGMSTKEIARELKIGTKTAESHRGNVMRKLNVHETASLVRYAIRAGLTEA